MVGVLWYGGECGVCVECCVFVVGLFGVEDMWVCGDVVGGVVICVFVLVDVVVVGVGLL